MLKTVSNARGDTETGEQSVQERETPFDVWSRCNTNINCPPDWYKYSCTTGYTSSSGDP